MLSNFQQKMMAIFLYFCASWLIFLTAANAEGNAQSAVAIEMRMKRDSDRMLKHLNGGSLTNAATTKPPNSSTGNNTVSDTDKRHRFNRLPVILPAVLTVVIFIVCVALIAYKSYNADDFPYDGSALDIHDSKETVTCLPKKGKQKKRGKNELYDVMLKEYKAEKHRKDPLRKSSTIQIEGVVGNDPQSIAKKHLLLNKMRDTTGGAVGTLIKLSSTAFIASSMVRDENKRSQSPIQEEDSTPLLTNEEHLDNNASPNDTKPINGKVPETELSNTEGDVEEKPEAPKIELVLSKSHLNEPTDDENVAQNSPDALPRSPDSLSPDFTSGNKDHRNSGPVWFKYKRLEKQSYVADDSDEELDYDCAQHIHRILSASRENIEEARRILPDDVKDIVLPKDLETALAEFELWPDSSV